MIEFYAFTSEHLKNKVFTDHTIHSPYSRCKEECRNKYRTCTREKGHSGMHETKYGVSKSSAIWYSDSSQL